jgi:hypothetical protein
MRTFAWALVVVALLAGCATIPPSQDADRVISLVEFIDSEPVDAVVDQSQIPFLFQDQIVYSQADLSAVLTRLRANGLSLDPQSAQIDSYPMLAGDLRFDQQVFADNLPEDARLVVVSSSAGRIELIVAGSQDGLPLLLGIQRGDS